MQSFVNNLSIYIQYIKDEFPELPVLLVCLTFRIVSLKTMTNEIKRRSPTIACNPVAITVTARNALHIDRV
jgi:hypothetical protein